MPRIKDKRVGTVINVSDAVAEMVTLDPDIVLVDDEEPKRRSRKAAESNDSQE